MDSVYLVRSHSALVVVILAACVSLIHGAPTSTRDETNRKDLKRDMYPASETATYALVAINKTFHEYCTHVPLMITSDCDQFMNMLKANADLQLPQVVIENELDDESGAIINMSQTVSQYLNLIKHYLDIEYNIVCEPARKIERECHFPKSCPSLPDTNDAILYCSLHTAYTYINNLNFHLQLQLSDTELTNFDVNSQLFASENLPTLARRWLTMLILNTSLNQIQHVQQKLNAMNTRTLEI